MSRQTLIGAAALAVAALPGVASGQDTEVLAQACSGCHLDNSDAAIPSITGRDADELTSLLLGYQEDTVGGTIMNRLAKGYTEAELRALAAYFASVAE